MSRRILPLVVVLTIALCPVALDVCQVACADHERGPVGTSSSEAHHHPAEPVEATVAHHEGHHAAAEAAAAATVSSIMVRGVPHGCLHGEDLPAFVGTNLQIALAPAAAVPTLFAIPAPVAGFRLVVDADSVVHFPPVTLTTQLRV